MFVPGLSENSVLLVKAAELLAGRGITNALFENTIMVASLLCKLIHIIISVFFLQVRYGQWKSGQPISICNCGWGIYSLCLRFHDEFACNPAQAPS
jgi:hypothetical protein